MPQVVEVASNTNAAQILRRDLRNVTEHLARFDARLLRFADAGHGLFQQFLRGELASVTGPEESAPAWRRGGGGSGGGGGGGRRGRNAEKGRAGRDKGQRAQTAHPGGTPPAAAVPGPPAGGQGPRRRPRRRR